MTRKLTLPKRFDFEILCLQSVGIISVCIVLATLLALIAGQRVEKESIDVGKLLTSHLATELAPLLDNYDREGARRTATRVMDTEGVVAVRITDFDHVPIFETSAPGYHAPVQFALPPMLEHRTRQVGVTDGEDAWRFSIPVHRPDNRSVGLTGRTALGYANVIISKERYEAKRVEIFIKNLISALVIGAAGCIFLGWATWHRIRNLRTLFRMLSGQDPSLWELRAASDGSSEVFHAIRNYQSTMATMAERERSLRKARDDAVGTAVAKAQFAATVSHEVRTPLNGIVGMLEMLKQGNLSASQRQQVDTAWNSAEALMRLLNTILDFSRLEAGKSEIVEGDFDLHQFIADVARVFTQQARQKSVDFTVSIDDSVPVHVVADSIRLRQVLTNILDNAVKFTDDGTINLDVRPETSSDGRNMLRFSVTDTGIGISPGGREQVFDIYVRDGQNRRLGSGLGLAIARQLIDMMGGEIAVSSEQGKGSTFWFTICYHTGSQAHGPVTTSPRVEPIEAAGDAESTSDKPLAGSHVLIVDDNRTNQQVAKQLISLLGADAVCCSDGIEAVAAVQKDVYDFILMDCNMPRMNGYDATVRIREIEGAAPQRKRATIIAVSAYSSDDNKARCIQSGMDGLLSKPITLDRVRSALLPTTPATPVASPSAPVSPSEAPVLDLAALNQLRGLLGDGLRDAVIPFLEDVPKYLSGLRDAVRENDHQRATSLAHTLKGCSIGLGVLRLHYLAKAAEDIARRGDLTGIEPLLKPMEEAFEASKQVFVETLGLKSTSD